MSKRIFSKSIGLNAAAVYEGQDEQVLKDIEDGIYSHVYFSPESVLSLQHWRNMLQSPATRIIASLSLWMRHIASVNGRFVELSNFVLFMYKYIMCIQYFFGKFW